MKISEWNNLRAKLHHDWLQNTYLTFLMARVEYMDTIEAHEAVRGDIVEQFEEFSNKKADFEILIDNIVNALSPAQLLDVPPLDRLSKENKKWLGDVIHALYCERTGIRKYVASLREKIKFISERYALLLDILHGKDGELLKRVGKEPFKNFYSQMQELSSMISALPHEVQVV